MTVTRRVKSAAGAKRYKLPIGTPIPAGRRKADALNFAAAGKAVLPGASRKSLADVRAMGRPAGPNEVQQAASRMSRNYSASVPRLMETFGAMSRRDFEGLPAGDQKEIKDRLKSLYQYNPELRKQIGTTMAKFVPEGSSAHGFYQKAAAHPGYTPTMAQAARHSLVGAKASSTLSAGSRERLDTFSRLTPQEFAHLAPNEQRFVLSSLDGYTARGDGRAAFEKAQATKAKLTGAPSARSAPAVAPAVKAATPPVRRDTVTPLAPSPNVKPAGGPTSQRTLPGASRRSLADLRAEPRVPQAEAFAKEGRVQVAPDREAALRELGGMTVPQMAAMSEHLGRGRINPGMSEGEARENLVRAIRGRMPRRGEQVEVPTAPRPARRIGGTSRAAMPAPAPTGPAAPAKRAATGMRPLRGRLSPEQANQTRLMQLPTEKKQAMVDARPGQGEKFAPGEVPAPGDVVFDGRGKAGIVISPPSPSGRSTTVTFPGESTARGVNIAEMRKSLTKTQAKQAAKAAAAAESARQAEHGKKLDEQTPAMFENARKLAKGDKSTIAALDAMEQAGYRQTHQRTEMRRGAFAQEAVMRNAAGHEIAISYRRGRTDKLGFVDAQGNEMTPAVTRKAVGDGTTKATAKVIPQGSAGRVSIPSPGVSAKPTTVAEHERAAEEDDLAAHRLKVKLNERQGRMRDRSADILTGLNRRLKEERALDEQAARHRAAASTHRAAAAKLREQGATPEDRATLHDLANMAEQAEKEGRHEDAARAYEKRAQRLRAGESTWKLTEWRKGTWALVPASGQSGASQDFTSRKAAEEWRRRADETTAEVMEHAAARQRKLAAGAQTSAGEAALKGMSKSQLVQMAAGRGIGGAAGMTTARLIALLLGRTVGR